MTRITGKCVSFVTETDKLNPEELWKVTELSQAEGKIAEESKAKKIKLEAIHNI